MLDSSGSIGAQHFVTMKSFVKDLIGHFKVSLNNTRVSVMSYDSSPSLHLTFSQAFPTRQDLYSAIDNITYSRGGTYTARGLRLAKSGMFNTKNGARVLGLLIADKSFVPVLIISCCIFYYCWHDVHSTLNEYTK